MSILVQAAQFAAKKHGEQRRQFTGELYIHHPLRVMNRVLIHPEIPGSRVAVAMAAVLHDVVEDCYSVAQQGIFDIRDRFGADVSLFVDGLTDVYTKEAYPDWNRAKRKAREACRLGQCMPEVQVVKMIDVIDNLESFFPLTQEMIGFGHTFALEAIDLGRVLAPTDPVLGVELFKLAYRLRDAEPVEMVDLRLTKLDRRSLAPYA